MGTRDSMDRQCGTVRRLKAMYGFIRWDDKPKEKLFFHQDDLVRASMRDITLNQRVEFAVVPSEIGGWRAQDVVLIEGTGLPPFNKLDFGEVSAEIESVRCPRLLSEGYFDIGGHVAEICYGDRYLILGYKGSGKSALGQHLRLISLDTPELFVSNLQLSDFPFVALSKIVDTDEIPLARLPVAWSWLLLLQLMGSFSEDQGAVLPVGSEFQRMQECLTSLGMIPSPAVKTLINSSSKASFKLTLAPFLEAGLELQRGRIEDIIPVFVEKLKRACCQFRSSSRHILVIDGLDDILTFEDLQYDSLGALLLEADRLNAELGRNSVPAKIVILCRADLFSRLPGPNKNKIRQASSIYLDWYMDLAMCQHSKLLDLVNVRAALSDNQVGDIFETYFSYSTRQKIVGGLLSQTRHLPRDFIQLLKCIQKCETKRRVGQNTVKQALVEYSQNYFLPEVHDSLAGFLQRNTLDVVTQMLAALHKRRFTVQELEPLAARSSEKALDVYRILNVLFECSAIGNVTEKEAIFRFSHPNAVFNPQNEIEIHKGLWGALGI